MIINGDMFIEVPKLDQVFDLIIFDPPYGIGNKKLELKSKNWKRSKENWDVFESKDEQYDFYKKSLQLLFPKLKDSGSLFVFGSFHNIYMIGEILQRELNAWIVNSIVWNKINAMFNISKTSLIEGTEHIIWSSKNNKKFFNYEYACSENDGKQLRNVWNSPLTSNNERIGHPHQKPGWLIQRIIKLACPEGGMVLDPMSGSGTTAVICQYLELQYICIEKNELFYANSCKRVKELASPFN